MFEKLTEKSKIRKLRKMIAQVEKKRIRSQAALVEAILTNTIPSDEDVDYFNRYTAEIDSLRETMHKHQQRLAQLEGKE